jgi:hypothetical protein
MIPRMLHALRGPGNFRQPARQAEWILFLLAVAIAVIYWPLLSGQAVLPWDALTEFYPNAFFYNAAIRSGQLPWWNPYIYAGVPQIADPQAMTFSPLLSFWMLWLANPSPTWFAYGVLLHLLLGGWAFSVFLRKQGCDFLGCTAGALIFVFGGVAMSRIEHVPIIVAYCYLAYFCAAYALYADKPGRPRALALGLLLGFFCVHLVQVTYLGIMFVAAFAACDLAWRVRTKPIGWNALLSGAREISVFVLIPALLVSLPQILCTLGYVAVSNRRSLPLSESISASLTLDTLQTLFSPNHFNALKGAYSGPANLTEAYFYVGMLPICALLAGFGYACHRESRFRRFAIFLACILIASCIYMLGTHTPVYGFIHEWVPGAHLFRRPSDSAFIFNFALAALAGIGLSLFGHLPRNFRIAIVTTSVLTLAWNLCALGRSDWVIGLVLALGGLAAGAAFMNGKSTLCVVAAIALIVVDFASTLNDGRLFASANLASKLQQSKVYSFLQNSSRESKYTWRIEGQNTSIWWDDFVMMAGLRSTQGYNPIRYGLFDALYGARPSGEAPRPLRELNAPGDVLFNLLSVRYLIVGRNKTELPPPADFRKVMEDDQFSLWENKHAYPRLLVPERMRLLPVNGNPAKDEFEKNDFSLSGWLTPRDSRDYRIAALQVPECHGKLTLLHADFRLDSLSVDVDSDAGGWLVNNDLDFPGWTAEIDGKLAYINRANMMFRSVCVPPGKHEVELSFHPIQMIVDAVISRSSYR